jgi:hypothetical protein
MTRIILVLKRTARYISNVALWLYKAKPLIAMLLGIVIVILFVGFASCLERQIRLSGMGLQLLGVSLVAFGLRETRQAFADQPTIFGKIKHWWSGRPTFSPTNRTIALAGGSFSISGGSARMRTSPGLNTPLDHRVTMLEQQYASLSDEVGTLADVTKTKISELNNSLAKESASRQNADLQVREQLREAVAEGIPLASVGVIAFLIGITAGTISPEIASFFAAASCN